MAEGNALLQLIDRLRGVFVGRSAVETLKGLNVNTTGAGAGQIRTSDAIIAGTTVTATGGSIAGTDAAGGSFEQHAVAGWGDVMRTVRGGTLMWAIQDASCTVASNGTAAASAGASDAALILVMVSSGYSAMFWLNGSANHTTTLVSDPIGAFSTTANTVGKTNVYWSGSRYEIQNKTAGANNYRIIEFKAP